MSDALKLGTPAGAKHLFRRITGQRKAELAQNKQQEALKKQQQIEAAALAEADSEIALRKARANRGTLGRGSLIATSPTGTNTTLGGG
jgi:hypothetical protein